VLGSAAVRRLYRLKLSRDLLGSCGGADLGEELVRLVQLAQARSLVAPEPRELRQLDAEKWFLAPGSDLPGDLEPASQDGLRFVAFLRAANPQHPSERELGSEPEEPQPSATSVLDRFLRRPAGPGFVPAA
jgi:hypothetical protein